MSEMNRQWLLNGRPDDADPKILESHFKRVEMAKPEPGPGEFLIRVIYFSCDPAQQGWMRGMGDYMAPMEIGDVMLAGATGQVVASNHPGYDVGDFVSGVFGWQDYVVSSGVDLNNVPIGKLPAGVPLASTMGALGTTGLTAYFGLLDIGEPQPGDTVLVSGAAGAVGSIAGQIAKMMNCRVIGIAGGAAKCQWVTGDLGFDACIDYKSEDVEARVAELAPEGVNVFFDNVGGSILEAGLTHMAHRGRIALCGGIAGYTKIIPGPANYMQLILMRCKMEGFIVLDYRDQFPAAIQRMSRWIAEGTLKEAMDIADGFDAAPGALAGLFQGANKGKQLVKIADDPTA